MSSASKLKSRDKKTGKVPPMGSVKLSGTVNCSEGIPSNAYNSHLGTFRTIETTPVPNGSPIQVNGRFRNIDGTDDRNGHSFGNNGTEYDSVSNNSSWSGESEDHKEKIPQSAPLQESIPGAENDKRGKIRQKNERKHQRQKERRAQELHERCSGYLMSRKLEALAQQLVAMGFSQEQATMSLILNEGKVEESVAWLFEGGEENKLSDRNLDYGSDLKIDISEELACMAGMKVNYKVSKQEVERAIVASEGDLEMAEETLKAQKQYLSPTPPKPDETSDLPIVESEKLSMAFLQNEVRVLTKPTTYNIQQKGDEKYFNRAKVSMTAGPTLDDRIKSMQVLRNISPKVERAKTHQINVSSDKRWLVSGSNPSVSYSLVSSLHASSPPAKMEPYYSSVGNELRNLQLGSVKDPIFVMQRPQPSNPRQAPISSASSSPPGIAMGGYHQSVETAKPNNLVLPIAVTRSLSPNGVSSNPSYNQHQYNLPQQFVSGSSSFDSQGTRGNAYLTKGVQSSTISPASSLGLFSGMGINSSSSPVDWTTGCSMSQFDYSNVDWSLDRGNSLLKPNGMLVSANYSVQNNLRSYDSFSYSSGPDSDRRPVLPNKILELQNRITSSEPSDCFPGVGISF